MLLLPALADQVPSRRLKTSLPSLQQVAAIRIWTTLEVDSRSQAHPCPARSAT